MKLSKIIFAVFLFTMSLNLKAKTPDPEMVDLARILMNNPLKQLAGFPACNDNLMEYTSKVEKPGVVKYQLTFYPGGFCEGKKAIVTITEDSNPMQSDGPRKYTSSVEVKPIN